MSRGEARKRILEATVLVKQQFPDAEMRFCTEKPDGWQPPMDRFPNTEEVLQAVAAVEAEAMLARRAEVRQGEQDGVRWSEFCGQCGGQILPAPEVGRRSLEIGLRNCWCDDGDNGREEER